MQKNYTKLVRISES